MHKIYMLVIKRLKTRLLFLFDPSKICKLLIYMNYIYWLNFNQSVVSWRIFEACGICHEITHRLIHRICGKKYRAILLEKSHEAQGFRCPISNAELAKPPN